MNTNQIPLHALLAMLQERLADTKIDGFVLGVYTADGEMQLITDDDALQNLALCSEMQTAIVQRVLAASQSPTGEAVH